MLELPRKTKDNLKARLDLKDMGIRHTLHPEKKGDDKTCHDLVLQWFQKKRIVS